MADIQHNAITDPDIHEPKGVATALAGDIYVADGNQSGAWAAAGGIIFGEMSIAGNTDTVTPTGSGNLDLDTDYVQIDNGLWSESVTDGILVNADGYLEIVSAGTYELSFWGCFHISAGSTNLVAFKFATDNTTSTLSPRRLTRQSNNAGDIGSVAASALVPLLVGDKVSLWVACDAAATTLTMIDAGMELILLAGA